MFDFDYYVIGPLMIVGPWLCGGFFGWIWGTTARRVTAAIALGAALTLGGFAALLLTSPPSAEQACGEDECVRVFHHWLEITLVRDWPVYTLIAWALGVAVASALRRGNRRGSNLPEWPQ